TSQVQIACDTAKGAAARLAGIEAPVFEDTESTLADLKARIAKTIAFLETVKPAQIDGTEDKEIVLKRRDQETRYKGMQFLVGHVSLRSLLVQCSRAHCLPSVRPRPRPLPSCARTR